MRYVLINHIAAHAGTDAAHVRLPAPWARDVLAAARAAAVAGVRLTVVTPMTNACAAADAVELVPDEAGFEHIALPHYDSARSFLHERAALSAALHDAITAADVVQFDLGGHPVPLGLFAEPIAHALRKRCLWMLDAGAASRLTARSRHAAKRMLGHALETRMRRTLGDALARATVVIANTDAAAADLRSRWGRHAVVVSSVDVIDAELASDATIAARHARLLDTSRPLSIIMPGELTIDRGTDHVLAAMHRCWRLRVPVTLVVGTRGSEVDAVRRHADELGLGKAVKFADAGDAADADVVIDAALSNLARNDLDAFVARGVPAIGYAQRTVSPGVEAIARGAVDELAAAVFRAATDRAALAGRMITGHAWTRERTIDAAHRRRFALAQDALRGARGVA